ncbi:hypothetical protein OQA88_9245 [Cercophora sp. LCS_1]
MESHPQSQSRSRKRPRTTRTSEAGNSANPTPVASHHQQPWGATVPAHQNHPTAVRGDTVPPSAFPSQQLDRSHQVAEDGFMNSYSAPQHGHNHHNQYQDSQSSLPSAAQPDPAGLASLNNTLNNIASDTNGATNQHQHPHAHQQHHLPSQQQTPQQHNQRSSGATANKTDRVLFQQHGANHSANDASPATVANLTPAASYAPQAWPPASTAPASNMPPQSPVARLAPPPDGIYPTYNDLMAAVTKWAKDQGYGVVKLRSSNYREGKPTRFDLVCDRGGVKYASTAKKRTPSTRKVDCPWRAKAVCEVNLGNQWRFAVQESRHNHEPRVPAAAPGQENTPIAQSMRSIGNKIDRLMHDMSRNFENLESRVNQRLEMIEKRLDGIEAGRASMLGANGVPSMGTPSMPPANMGGPAMGNGALTNGGMGSGVLGDGRISGIEARINVMDQQRNGMDSLPMMEDETGRLTMMVNP